MDIITLNFQDQPVDIPLTVGLIFTLEDEHGSLIGFLQNVQASDVKTKDMVAFLKTAISTTDKSNLDIEDLLKKTLQIKGIAGLTEHVIRILSPLVAGISILQDLEPAEYHREAASLGKSKPKKGNA